MVAFVLFPATCAAALLTVGMFQHAYALAKLDKSRSDVASLSDAVFWGVGAIGSLTTTLFLIVFSFSVLDGTFPST